MNKIAIIVLALGILVSPGCKPDVSEIPKQTAPINIQQVSSWKYGESTVTPAVATSLNGKDYVFAGIHPNDSRNDSLIVALDVTNPTIPVQVGSLVVPKSMMTIVDLAMRGTTIYTSLYGGYWIIDISNPENLRQLSVLEDGNYPRNVFLNGNFLYSNVPTLDNNVPNISIHVIDVSDPSNPKLAANVPVDLNAIIREASGNRLYCTGFDGLRIFDISSPLEPRQIGFYAGPTIPTVNSATSSDWDTMVGFQNVVVSGKYAFVASGINGFLILDVSDPANVTEVSRLIAVDVTQGISISGDIAFLLGVKRDPFGFELVAVNIAQVVEPKEINSVDLQTFYCLYPPFRFGDFLYLPGIPELRIFDIYAPMNTSQ